MNQAINIFVILLLSIVAFLIVRFLSYAPKTQLSRYFNALAKPNKTGTAAKTNSKGTNAPQDRVLSEDEILDELGKKASKIRKAQFKFTVIR